MKNIDISQFPVYGSLAEDDYVVISLLGGSSGRVAVGVLGASLSSGVTPTIKDGVWWIGTVDTGVKAEGKTPELRRGELGVEYRYTGEDDTAWKLLVPFEDIKLQYKDLTEQQQDSLRLKFSDLTEEQVKELQKPASDMIDILSGTNDSVMLAESSRVEAEGQRKQAEAERAKNETSRESAEMKRASAESGRALSEEERARDEVSRNAAETQRKDSESVRVLNERERSAAESGRKEAERVRDDAENSRNAAEAGRVSAEEYRVMEFAVLREESMSASMDARDTASHPTYVGEDNYVYEWNKVSGTYNKTGIYVKGESFSIKKVYPSVSAMFSDGTTPFKEGDFVLIDTGNVEDPDNAKLYVRNGAGSWDFLVDMSGAIGFTGKTPQLFIGKVSVGSGVSSAAVTVTPSGYDSDGNPQYDMNYVLPYLSYEDLTSEQIAELQRPAAEMIARLEAVEESVSKEESARVKAEKAREDAEKDRAGSESERKASEESRLEAEAGRSSAENTRRGNEMERIAAENRRKESENGRADAESDRNAWETQRRNAEAGRLLSEEERRESESEREAAEAVRAASENERLSNENERLSAERERLDAEAARVSSETERNGAELLRAGQEELRRSAESEREASESAREYSEAGRVSAEQERVLSENLRHENEGIRNGSEQKRESSEETRTLQEQERVRNEAARQSAELLRQTAESERGAAEERREENESLRTETELDRQRNEQSRSADYAELRKEIQSATKEALDASAQVRNVPKIQDGTWWIWDVDTDSYMDSGSPATSRSPKIIDGIWWTWDDASAKYVSTGVSVNSEFQLTKEGIEAVFVGDIVSHTHDHLRYRAQTYDSMPDLSSLHTWSDASGEHAFLPGNDIYVADESEPTGYANYKLSPSTEGDVWVRVPQVAPGWRILLVKE